MGFRVSGLVQERFLSQPLVAQVTNYTVNQKPATLDLKTPNPKLYFKGSWLRSWPKEPEFRRKLRKRGELKTPDRFPLSCCNRSNNGNNRAKYEKLLKDQSVGASGRWALTHNHRMYMCVWSWGVFGANREQD